MTRTQSTQPSVKRLPIATLSLAATIVVLVVCSATHAAAPAGTARRTASSSDVAPDSAADKIDPGRIVFLLEYIGTDYDNAVRGGRIVDPFEHRELTDFCHEAAELYARAGRSEAIASDLKTLARLIRDMKPWDEVRTLGLDLATRVSDELVGPLRFTQGLDVSRGGQLYGDSCAVCHGATGDGNGEAASGMDPPPSSFRRPDMRWVRPRQVRAAITFGVDGTAMPSFGEALTDEQLWEITFHVMTLHEGFDPRPPAAELPLALEDLAVSSNEDLLTWLRALRREAAASDIDFYRLHPPGPRLEPSSAGSPEAPPYAQAAPDPGIEAATILENAFGTVAKDAFPSVVGLSFYVRDTSAGRKAKAASAADGPPGWQNAADGRPAYPGYRLLRAGTGFFVDEDGSILTCHHLLVDPKTGEPAEIIDVEMQNNHHVRARVIGTEPTVNLAVLKAEAPVRWPTAALGDDAPPRVGQWAIALADPPGIERTFVPGVISAIPERDCYQAERASTMIQTSLRIGAESFGGPIVDIRGKVLGISMPASPAAWIPGASTVGRGKAGTPAHVNDALAETTGSGPVFALPIHLAMTLYEALKVKESRRSPWLGISVLDLWADLPRKTLKSLPPSGVFIDGVFDPSPASRAGIRIQDVLTAMDGNRVSAVQDFQRWLYLLGIGKTITLEIFRNGEVLEKRITIEERPAAAAPR